MTYTHSMRNGVLVPLIAGEIAEFEARDAAWDAAAPARAQARDRYDDLAVDAQAMIDRLTTMTATQIDAYFASDVHDLPQVIAALKAVCKLLAVRVMPAGTLPL